MSIIHKIIMKMIRPAPLTTFQIITIAISLATLYVSWLGYQVANGGVPGQ